MLHKITQFVLSSLMIACNCSIISYGMEDKVTSKEFNNEWNEQQNCAMSSVSVLQITPNLPTGYIDFEIFDQGRSTIRPIRFYDLPFILSCRYTLFSLKNEDNQSSVLLLLLDSNKSVVREYCAYNISPSVVQSQEGLKENVQEFIKHAQRFFPLTQGIVISENEGSAVIIKKSVIEKLSDCHVEIVKTPVHQLLLDKRDGILHMLDRLLISKEKVKNYGAKPKVFLETIL